MQRLRRKNLHYALRRTLTAPRATMFRIDRARPLFIKAIMRKIDMEPDPWQLVVATSQHPRMLLNCCRQVGKSTIVAMDGRAR